MLSYVCRRAAGAIAAASVPIGLLACGAGENGMSFAGPEDAGAGDSTAVDAAFDGGHVDALADGGPAPDAGAPPPTTVVFVDASPSFNARLCWARGGVVASEPPFPSTGVMPASNYPGIPRGGALAMANAGALVGVDTLYAIDAKVLAHAANLSQLPCSQLVCPGGAVGNCLNMNRDYATMTLPASASIRGGVQNVVSISGCSAIANDPAATVERCGSTWTMAYGNMHAETYALAPAPTRDAGAVIAIQAAQLSPGLANLAGDAGPSGAVVSFGVEDAGDAAVVAMLSQEGDLQPPSPLILPIGTDLPLFGAMGFGVDVPADDSGAGHLWMSLAQAQELVDPTLDPRQFFAQPQTYLVAVLGDPLAGHAFAASGDDGGGYDGTGLHLLVVTTPTPSSASDD
jgi:hypothetical protein